MGGLDGNFPLEPFKKVGLVDHKHYVYFTWNDIYDPNKQELFAYNIITYKTLS